MFTLDQSPGRTTFINGEEYLFFSGYSYLGMSYVPEFVSLVKEGLIKYGILYPSSRVSNTRLNVFEEMETLLSQLTSREETLLYSSGFLSGKAIIDWVEKQTAKCFIAPKTHPALQTHTATLLRKDWQQHLTEIILSTSEELIVLIDSVNPLTATVNDFSFLNNITLPNKITLIIDDSHGIGLLGNTGEGISALLPKLANVEYVITFSLSKAFHMNGGAICCSKKIAKALRQSPFYTASTSIAPALAYAFINAQQLYHQQRKKLQNNITLMQQALHENYKTADQRLPIVVLSSILDQEFFTPHNIIISSFSYPDPSGEKINRIVLNALHTNDDIEKITYIINPFV